LVAGPVIMAVAMEAGLEPSFPLPASLAGKPVPRELAGLRVV